MNQTSEGLISLAAKTYRESNLSHRDAILEVGRLVHQFVLAFLAEGAGIDRHDKVKAGITRERAVDIASERLGIGRTGVNALIRRAQTVELLSGGVPIGSLGLRTIYTASVFIKRGRLSGVARDNTTDTETWKIRKGYEEIAPHLFQQAIADGAGQDTMAERVSAVIKRQRHAPQTKKLTKTQEEAVKVIGRASRHGSPRDIAEILFETIKDTPEAFAIVAHLKTMLEEQKKNRRLTA